MTFQLSLGQATETQLRVASLPMVLDVSHLFQWLHPRPCHHREVNPLKLVDFTRRSLSEATSPSPLPLAHQSLWDFQLLHSSSSPCVRGPPSLPAEPPSLLASVFTVSSYLLINFYNRPHSPRLRGYDPSCPPPEPAWPFQAMQSA